MKVLVTGGAGFIGANLTRRLVAAGEQVIVLDDLSTGIASNVGGYECELVVGSILDPALVAKCAEHCDAIVHLAARPSVPRSLQDPVRSHDVNVTGTVNVLEAARRFGCHVSIASSSSVYGASDVLPKHEDLPTRPRSPYAASKLAAEAYSLAYQEAFELPVIAFRFFNVYGPLQRADHAYAAVIPIFLSRALAGKPLPIHGTGNQTRDFTFVDSVTDVLTKASRRRQVSAEPVNLAFGSRHSLIDIVAVLETLLGKSLSVEHLPVRAGDVRDSQADNRRLLSLFHDVEPTEIENGIALTLRWFRDHGG